MHVDAIGAAVDLRGSDPHQLAQGRVELDLVELLGRGVVEVCHGAGEVGGVGLEIEPDRDLMVFLYGCHGHNLAADAARS